MKKIFCMIISIGIFLFYCNFCYAKEWTQDEAVSMVKSWVEEGKRTGQGFNWDNAGNGWDCVDVPLRYYNELTDIKVTGIGNARDYRSNWIPDGWIRESYPEYTPQAGDVLVWIPGTRYAHELGHVAVAISGVDSRGYITFVDQDSFKNRPPEINSCSVSQIACSIIPPFNQSGYDVIQQGENIITIADEEINEPSGGWKQESVKTLLKNWVDSHIGIDFNGVNGYDEVDVLLRYIRHISGEALDNMSINNFTSCELPNGWKRFTSNEYIAQSGDIVVWKGRTGPAVTNDGHAGIVYEKTDNIIRIIDQDSTRQRPPEFNDYKYRGNMYFLVPPFNQNNIQVNAENSISKEADSKNTIINNNTDYDSEYSLDVDGNSSDNSTNDDVNIVYDYSLGNSESTNFSNQYSSSSNSNSSSYSSSNSSYRSKSSSNKSRNIGKNMNGSATIWDGSLSNNASKNNNNLSKENSKIPLISASVKKATLGIEVLFQINASQGAFNLIEVMNNSIVKNSVYILDTINLFTGQTSSDTYYFDKEGKMYTGWAQDSKGIYYYFDESNSMDRGKMVTGWKKLNGNYYFFKADGKMLTNAMTPDGYKVDSNGVWVR